MVSDARRVVPVLSLSRFVVGGGGGGDGDIFAVVAESARSMRVNFFVLIP